MSKNGKRIFINEKRVAKEQAEALEQNELHAQFYGVANTPLVEVRQRLDVLLRAHAIRKITEIDIGESNEE